MPGHRKIIFFVPGYYGTNLVEKKTGKKIFLTVREALFGHDSLAYPFPGLLTKTLDLEATELFDSISVVPFLYSIDAYGGTIKSLEKWGQPKGFRVITHPYDWRRDVPSLAKDLKSHFDSLELQTGDEVILVAHSMGALIASYYLRFGDQDSLAAKENFEATKKFRKIILAGAPFRGTMSVFRNTFFGAPLIPSDELLSPLAISSFPSTFFLLAPPGKNEVWDAEGKSLHLLPLYELKTWEEGHYGLFQKTFNFPDSTLSLRREWTEQWLKKSAAFFEKMQSPTSHPPLVPILLLTGHGTKTNELGIETQNSEKPFAYTPAQYEKLEVKAPPKISDVDGDGTVSSFSSHPLPFLEQMKAKWYDLEVSHGALIKDEASEKIWTAFLDEK